MTISVSLYRDWPSNPLGELLATLATALALIPEAIGVSLIGATDSCLPVITAVVGTPRTSKSNATRQTLLAEGRSSDRAQRQDAEMPIVERFGRWVAHRLLSEPWAERLSFNLARVGLHGLGVAPPFDLERSGEKRIYATILRKISGARCLDVGANIGEFTAMLARLGATHVVAIEPIPSAFKRLQCNTGSLGNVDFLRCAVGERDGQTSIDVLEDDELSGLSSRDIEVTEVPDQIHRTECVPLRSIDSLVEEHGWRFDIIKIDVEGFELEVLEGAAGLLANDPPAIVQFEFNSHHGRRGHHLTKLTDLLKNYDLYRIAPRSLRPIDPRHYLSSVYAYQNILAVRRDRTDLITTR